MYEKTIKIMVDLAEGKKPLLNKREKESFDELRQWCKCRHGIEAPL